MRRLLISCSMAATLGLAGCGGGEDAVAEASPEEQGQGEASGAGEATSSEPSTPVDEQDDADTPGDAAGELMAYPGVGGVDLMVTDSVVWWVDTGGWLMGLPREDLQGVEVSEPGEQLSPEPPGEATRVEVADEWVYPVTRVADEESMWILAPDTDRLGRFDSSELMSGGSADPAVQVELDDDVVDQLVLVQDTLWLVGLNESEHAYDIIGLDALSLEEATRLSVPAPNPSAPLEDGAPSLVGSPSSLAVEHETGVTVVPADDIKSPSRLSTEEINAGEELPLGGHVMAFFLADGRLVLAGYDDPYTRNLYVTMVDPQTMEVLGQMPALDQDDQELGLVFSAPVAAPDDGVDLLLTRQSMQRVSFPTDLGPQSRVEVEDLVLEGDVPAGLSGVPLLGVPQIDDGRAWWGDQAGVVSMSLP